MIKTLTLLSLIVILFGGCNKNSTNNSIVKENCIKTNLWITGSPSGGNARAIYDCKDVDIDSLMGRK